MASGTKGVTIPIPKDPAQYVEAFKMVSELCREWVTVHEQEKTKRTGIEAQRDACMEKLRSQRKVMNRFLDGHFQQQATALNGLFRSLDTAIASGNPDLVGPILTGIVETVRNSPLGDLVTLDQRMKNDEFTLVFGKD